jgi:hypothetical protein
LSALVFSVFRLGVGRANIAITKQLDMKYAVGEKDGKQAPFGRAGASEIVVPPLRTSPQAAILNGTP